MLMQRCHCSYVHLIGVRYHIPMPTRDLPAESPPCATCQQVAAVNERLRAELAAAQAQIAQLQAELTEAHATIAQLEAQHQCLQQELTALKQAPFTPRRRRRSQPLPDTTAKPRGRPVGHPGSSRPRPAQIDQTERVPLGDVCPDCGSVFTGRILERDRVVEDITPVRPTSVTRYVIERRWCGCCREFKEAPVTAALPNHRLGLHVMLFVVYQKVALGLSYGKIQRELAIYFGLQVSEGELPDMVAELAHLFGPAYARLIRLMRQQAAIHIDETGWRIDGTNHWLWVFVNDMVALYVISRSRGSKVPQALLGPDFDGVVISDFFSAYGPLEVEKAKCWAHLLRDSHTLAKGQPAESERGRFHTALHQLFLEMGVALEEVNADPAARDRVAQEMRTQLGAFAQGRWRDWDCQRLAHRIRTHLDELLVWLRNPAVSATNNTAERALRPVVVTRKTSFGSRSKRGALDFARLLSLIQTWERQGQDFFAVAHGALVDAVSQS
jgi:transposase